MKSGVAQWMESREIMLKNDKNRRIFLFTRMLYLLRALNVIYKDMEEIEILALNLVRYDFRG